VIARGHARQPHHRGRARRSCARRARGVRLEGPLARIKSDALGIKTEDFENQKVDADRLYTGYFEVTVPRR
jgi:hypothetical protein